MTYVMVSEITLLMDLVLRSRKARIPARWYDGETPHRKFPSLFCEFCSVLSSGLELRGQRYGLFREYKSSSVASSPGQLWFNRSVPSTSNVSSARDSDHLADHLGEHLCLRGCHLGGRCATRATIRYSRGRSQTRQRVRCSFLPFNLKDRVSYLLCSIFVTKQSKTNKAHRT